MPTLAAIFLKINALIILVMIVCLIAHEATAIWDVHYAYSRREVRPTEQHVHSFRDAPADGSTDRHHRALAAISGAIRAWSGGGISAPG